MDLENTERAFAMKSDSDLRQAHGLFSLIAFPWLIRLGSVVLPFLLNLHIPIAPLLKATLFKHFCAGTGKKESLQLVERLSKFKVFSYVHYATEAILKEKGMDASLERTLETFSFSKNSTDLPFVVFKPTSLGRMELFEKIGQQKPLSPPEQQEWKRVVGRFEKCCEAAEKLSVNILIDAEESWLQDAIDQEVLMLMRGYNKSVARVHTTVQMYRKDRLAYIEQLIALAKQENFKIGIKLVRGAYIDKENKYAQSHGIPSAICPNKNATDENFNKGLDLILTHLYTISLFLGTHNEDSVKRVVAFVEKNKLSKQHPHLWFSQLYGMSDNITFNLAEAGFQTVKYLPFGPVREVVPYLIRRAEENTSVTGHSAREIALIKKELKRRKALTAAQES